MAQRVKGQDVQLRILQNGVPLANLTAIRSCTFEFLFETLEEMYLGETSSRYDTVQKGVEVKVSFHHDDPQVLQLIQAIADQATERVPGLRIDVVATLKFPNGKSPKVSVPDMKSGPVPLVTAGKNQYVQSDFTFKASTFRFLQAA